MIDGHNFRFLDGMQLGHESYNSTFFLQLLILNKKTWGYFEEYFGKIVEFLVALVLYKGLF